MYKFFEKKKLFTHGLTKVKLNKDKAPIDIKP
jgi:hypothetical protein